MVTTPLVVNPPSVIEVLPVNAVKVPAAAVVAPIAVELIPVAVVLKFDDVNVKAFAPVEIDEADSPERESVPEVAVRFKAPAVWVNPLLAVSVPAEVIAPVPVVEILFPVVLPLLVTVFNVSASVEVTVNVPELAFTVVIPDPVSVKVPPKATDPVPVFPAVFIEEFANCPFVMPAVADKFDVVNPEMAVFVTPLTLPWASVVITGIVEAFP